MDSLNYGLFCYMVCKYIAFVQNSKYFNKNKIFILVKCYTSKSAAGIFSIYTYCAFWNGIILILWLLDTVTWHGLNYGLFVYMVCK